MGITGLLPLLKSIHRPVRIDELRGETIGVDAYCWLHKACYSCAQDLALGIPTNGFLEFCVNRLELLLHHKIIPIFVFDGRYLPMKAEKEKEREARRNQYRDKGLLFWKTGQKALAFECFQKCVNVTPEMALELIKILRSRRLDYIVAPYEADAQLAYLDKQNIISAIITEDSDLIVYGCKRIIYKMDKFGDGIEVRYKNLSSNESLDLAGWTHTLVRQMCILSGCDYVTSIQGIGLKTAYKLLKQHRTVENVVKYLDDHPNYDVPKDYLETFIKADLTFQHQRVYDSIQGRLVHLSPLPHTFPFEETDFLGPELDDSISMGIAIGNINPISLEILDTYNPFLSSQNIPMIPFKKSSQESKIMKSTSHLMKNQTIKSSLAVIRQLKEELSSSQLTEPLIDSMSESNSQNPFLRTESASQDYSPYFSRSSSRLIVNSSNDFEKENDGHSFNHSFSRLPERKQPSQDLSSTSNPFVSSQRLTVPIKRKPDYGDDVALKQLNLDRFMYSFNSTSV